MKRQILGKKSKGNTKYAKKSISIRKRLKPLLLDYRLQNKKAMNKETFMSKLNRFS